jgi:hypothetical protein
VDEDESEDQDNKGGQKDVKPKRLATKVAKPKGKRTALSLWTSEQ